jgi:hypothetical protein
LAPIGLAGCLDLMATRMKKRTSGMNTSNINTNWNDRRILICLERGVTIWHIGLQEIYCLELRPPYPKSLVRSEPCVLELSTR